MVKTRRSGAGSALRRFLFDSVLFPLSFVQMAGPSYRRDTEALLSRCHELDVGTMIIKSITRSPWGEHAETHTTWYRPFEEPADVQRAVDFVLSHDVAGTCTAGGPVELRGTVVRLSGYTGGGGTSQPVTQKTLCFTIAPLAVGVSTVRYT